MIGTVGVMNDNERINNHNMPLPLHPADNFFLNEQNIIQNQNNNRRRELLFLFYFVLIFIAVRIWIIIISSGNQFVIILSAILTGLIFALLCFRCRPFPQNVNPNPAIERNNNDPLNDFHIFMLQAANNHHSRRAYTSRNDSALPMETYENLECFLYKNIKLANAYERSRDAMGNVINARVNNDNIEDNSPPLFITRKQQAVTHSTGDNSNRWRLGVDESVLQGDIESLHTIEECENVPDSKMEEKMEEKVDEVPIPPPLSARSDSLHDNWSTCSVCLSDFQPQDLMLRLPCSHFYHKACVSMWFSQHNTCPLCKQNVTVMLHNYYGITAEDLEEPITNASINNRNRVVTVADATNNFSMVSRSVNQSSTVGAPNNNNILNSSSNRYYTNSAASIANSGGYGGVQSNRSSTTAVGRPTLANDHII